MAYTTQETIFKYVYLAFGFVFAVSLVFLAFMKGVTPFNTHLSYSGTSLVLTQYEADPAVGKRVARAGAFEGRVELYKVLETYRQDGELYYRAVPVVGGDEETIQARSAQHVVMATIPLIGLWVRVLGYPIGALALLGIPLLTFALDLMLVALGSAGARALRRTFAYLERRRESRRDTHQEEEEYEIPAHEPAKEVPAISAQYGMTVHLSRPRRYSM